MTEVMKDWVKDICELQFERKGALFHSLWSRDSPPGDEGMALEGKVTYVFTEHHWLKIIIQNLSLHQSSHLSLTRGNKVYSHNTAAIFYSSYLCFRITTAVKFYIQQHYYNFWLLMKLLFLLVMCWSYNDKNFLKNTTAMLMSSKPAINDKLQNACEQLNSLQKSWASLFTSQWDLAPLVEEN